MTIPQVLIKNATIDGRKVLFWEPKAMLPSPQPFGQELHHTENLFSPIYGKIGKLYKSPSCFRQIRPFFNSPVDFPHGQRMSQFVKI